MTLYIIAAMLIGAPLYGQILRWRDQAKARRIAEEERICAPLPVERVELTEPWPARVSPTDLAEAYQPATLREALILQRPEPILVGEVIVDDFTTCLEPCTAKHCAIHSGLSGCDYIEAQAETHAIHTAWNTKTAEWSVSLLGLAEASAENFRALVGSAT